MAFLSWPIQDRLLGSPFAVFVLLPVLPWAISIVVLLLVKNKPLRHYWWVLPSAIPGLHTLLIGFMLMLAWSIGGFAP